MLSAFREYTLDVWDWILGRKYPRQELLETLRERSRLFPAHLKESEIGPVLAAKKKLETALVRVADVPPPLRLVRQPSMHGMWEREEAEWHDTHPGSSSVMITHHVASHQDF